MSSGITSENSDSFVEKLNELLELTANPEGMTNKEQHEILVTAANKVRDMRAEFFNDYSEIT